MNYKSRLRPLSLLVVIIIMAIASCKSVTTNDDFIAKYKIDLTAPVDTDPGSISQTSKIADWVFSLEENNNFHLYGTGINKVGYWRIENDSGQDFDLLLQSGETSHARIDKNRIYFTYRTGILDSMFKKVTFVRIENN